MLAARRRLLLTGRPAVLFDQFTDGNGTALTSHKIAPLNRPGAAWALNAGTGTATTQGNRVQLNPNGSAAGSHWWADAKVSDLTLTATLKFLAAQDCGLLFRRQDATHFWLADFLSTGTVTLYQDGATSKATGSFSFSLNTDYQVKVTARGPLIQISVNGRLVTSFASATYQGKTGVGLAIGGNSTANQVQWDDFKVAA